MTIDPKLIERISKALNISRKQIEATLTLIEQDATVPFIARYRKEATGSLDEVAITAIRDLAESLTELDKRRAAILKSLTERSLLTTELADAIARAETPQALEDIYLPHRPKKKTRAIVAKDAGLEPLAEAIFRFETDDPADLARSYLNSEKAINSIDDALKGARDIIAEWINEDRELRTMARSFWENTGTVESSLVKGKESEAEKFQDYFSFQEQAKVVPSHRMLAMLRGQSEGYLKVRVTVSNEEMIKRMEHRFARKPGKAADEIKVAISDCLKRLLAPSMETEVLNKLKDRADQEAIRVFADNLRNLLLASPLGQKNVLAIDPGFRTGCKLVCLNKEGKLLHHDVIYPHTTSDDGVRKAEEKLSSLLDKFDIDAIAVGNGTASRETDAFVRKTLKARKEQYKKEIAVVSVNESGASIYSASDVAREEFPDHDVTVRGAVSIGRRLMDPLAELVKIDPKSIGVGQYQHDVDQASLRKSLDDVVLSCVNKVGVEVNTASKQLLSYVSGVGSQIAANIVTFRDEHGPFKTRQELKRVPRLGPKSFEQAAGFLRIRDAANQLDKSAVHPESYYLVEAMARDLGCSVGDLMSNADLRQKIKLQNYVSESVGLPTLNDILAELAKPGRDPREQLETVQFQDDINSIDDLKPGMTLTGIVTNVTAFGAFVDIGVHQDGLVHISELADRFIKNPAEVVSVQQKVTVKVLTVDTQRKRIALSMRNLQGANKR